MQIAMHDAEILSATYKTSNRAEWVDLKIKHQHGECELTIFGKHAQAIAEAFRTKETADVESGS